jgi:hypothetical protein
MSQRIWDTDMVVVRRRGICNIPLLLTTIGNLYAYGRAPHNLKAIPPATTNLTTTLLDTIE